MTLPQDPEALKQTVVAALGLTPERCDSREAVEVYRYALLRSWTRMEEVVGSEGARAILQYAVRITARRHPKAALVVAGDQGPDLSKLNAEASAEDLCDSRDALQELYLATFRILVELTGEVIAAPLLEELRQHEGGRGSG